MIAPIPLTQGLDRAIDESGNRVSCSRFYDVYIDNERNINRRPGLHPAVDLEVSASIDGLYWWEKKSLLCAVANEDFYIEVAGVLTLVASSVFNIGNIVYFAEYGDYLYAANGGTMKQIESDGTVNTISDGDAPTTVTAIDIIDTYLVALKAGTEQIWYADAGNPTSWSAVFVSAVYRTDDIKMIGVRNNILEAFGTQSIEGFRTTGDATTPFISEDSYTIEVGIDAPDTAVFCRSTGTWYWLSSDKCVVKMVGRQAVPIAQQTLGVYIASLESSVNTTTTAFAGECFVNGIPHYIINFSSSINKTIAINLLNEEWYEFGNWNGSSHDRWRGRTYTRYRTDGYQYVGDISNGKIYQLRADKYQDNAGTLCTLIRSPIIDRGALFDRKFPKRLSIWTKKTSETIAGNIETATIKWRDRGSSSYKTSRTFNLGKVDDTDIINYINNPGSYLARQYEISVTANQPFCLVKMDEEF